MESQNKKILEYMKKGNAITHLIALQKFDCARLAARILNLREAGHSIHTERVKTTSGKVIGKYTLLKLAGE